MFDGEWEECDEVADNIFLSAGRPAFASYAEAEKLAREQMPEAQVYLYDVAESLWKMSKAYHKVKNNASASTD